MDSRLKELPEWPIALPDFALDLSHTALVVVDMQEVHCRPELGLGRMIETVPSVSAYFWPRLESVVANQKHLLDFFRARRAHRLFLTIGPNASDGSDLAPWRRRRNDRMNATVGGNSYPKADSSGPRGILKDLEVREDEIVLNKPTFGAFASTGIDQVLRSWDTRQLGVCGQATNVCVYLTAGEAADRGYECCVVEDACAAYSDALHIAFLQNFALLFGRVADTPTVLAELDSAASGATMGSEPAGSGKLGGSEPTR